MQCKQPHELLKKKRRIRKENCMNLQLFADSTASNPTYKAVVNPYQVTLVRNILVKGYINILYGLASYYKNIPNYSTITTLPEENTEYIKKALPSVTNCTSMLYSCKALTSVDTTGWDTSNITNMNAMFASCTKL